jgi:ABC-type transporter Mla subunit MlaD
MLAQDEHLTRKVGAITIVVGLVAIVFVVLISDRIEWRATTRITVTFASTGNLREGAPFVVAGREVGEVESIALLPTGGVAVGVALEADAARRIGRGGDVFVATRGTFGEQYLEIGPDPDPEGPPLREGDALVGREPPSMDRVLQRTWDNLTIAKQFAEAVAPEFTALRTELRTLGATVDELVPANLVGVATLGIELDGLVAEARRLRDVTLGGETGLAALGAMLDRARATIAQARQVLDLLEGRATKLATGVDTVRGRVAKRGPAAVTAVELAITRLRAALDKIDPLLAKAADLRSRLARGEGSIGRLMQDPEFPEDAKDLGKMLKRAPWKIIARPRQ